MNKNITNREDAVNQAVIESDRSDLKQHAEKMLRAFEDFNDFSSNRAIWELVQNACDLTIDCEITIDYRNDQFAFTHNGKPFTSNAFISLIKQVSGDKDELSEIPPVGKYGTGFLTTHSLGRQILLDGFLKIPDGYTEIKAFKIDRRPKESNELIDKIREQKDQALEIIRSGESIEVSDFKTTFTYLQESDQEKKYVADSYTDLEKYIPIVLTINKRLQSISIISQSGSRTHFMLSGKDTVIVNENFTLYKTCISKDGKAQVVYSIADPGNDIEIILPVDKDLNLFAFSERIARLFLYYPLVGSEDFGINFIINCNSFLPTEPRNGIHLNSNKDQVKDQEEANRKLIDKATDLLFSFLNSNYLPVSNPLLYAKINFKRNSDDQFLNKYFNELQAKWITQFKSLEIVKTKSGYKKVEEVAFFDPSLLLDPEYFDCIYFMADLFYDVIPEKDVIHVWSNFVYEWQYQEASFIDNIDIAKKLHGGQLELFDRDLLHKYYSYLADTNKVLFTDYQLLPNIHGRFQQINFLKNPHNIDPILLKIGNTIFPKVTDQLIHEDFVLNFTPEPFRRKHFWNEMNTALNELVNDRHFCLPENYDRATVISDLASAVKFEQFDLQLLSCLLDYCKLNTKAESKSKPTQLLAIISKYYDFDSDLPVLQPLTDADDELDLRIAQKKLVKIFFNSLGQHNEQWIQENISLLYNVIQCNEDRYKDVYLNSKIYPDQMFNLRFIADLRKDIDITPEMMRLYNKVMRAEIRSMLAEKTFNEFLTENESFTNKDLATKIENAFFDTQISDINEHPFKDEILKIIPLLNQEAYKILFPRLDDKRAKLMLDVVTNENTKDDIFLIVTLDPTRLKQIGQLIQQENIDEILLKAQNEIRHENERHSDFAHKYAIGTYVEDQVRKYLAEEFAAKIRVDKDKNVLAEDIQGGQDIVIFYGEEELYYIEVKSRWDNKNSVFMSKLQLEKASKFKDRYALLSVDVTKYLGTKDRYKLSIEDITPLIRVLDNIGTDIMPLIENNLRAETDQESIVKLVEYRGLVNQETISNGKNFEEFTTQLIEYLGKQVQASISSVNQREQIAVVKAPDLL